jgi:hypothetical protein
MKSATIRVFTYLYLFLSLLGLAEAQAGYLNQLVAVPSSTNPNVLVFTGNNILPVDAVVGFQSSRQACDYFGLGSPECTQAEQYFAGYSGPTITLYFSRLPSGGARARDFSIPEPSLAAIQAGCNMTIGVCPASLTYDIDANINPSGYTVPFSVCADTTSPLCLPPQQVAVSGTATPNGTVAVPTTQIVLTWSTAIASPNALPAGDSLITISSGSDASGPTLNGNYTTTDASANYVTFTVAGTVTCPCTGTITFNPSWAQVASYANDSFNAYVYNNPLGSAAATGTSVTGESCNFTGYVLFQFMVVTSTAGCSIPFGANVATTPTGIVNMGQISGTPGGAGVYVTWTTFSGGCCTYWQPGPSNSNTAKNPTYAFTAYWGQLQIGSSFTGTLATAMAVVANNPAIYLFGGDGPYCTTSHAFCWMTSANSAPATGVMGYVSGGSVTQTATGAKCAGAGCEGSIWILSCAYANPIDCGTTAQALNFTSPPLQISDAEFTGPDGTSTRLIAEQSSWLPYNTPFGTMQLMTGTGAHFLGLGAGDTGTDAGGFTYGNLVTISSHTILDYHTFFSTFLTYFNNFGWFQIYTNVDGGYGVNTYNRQVKEWAAENHLRYIDNFDAKMTAAASWPPPPCTPGVDGPYTSGSGTRNPRHCRNLTIRITGAGGAASSPYNGGSGAFTEIDNMTLYADEYPATYSIAAGGSGNPTTVNLPYNVQTNDGSPCAAAGPCGTISVAPGGNATSGPGAAAPANSGDNAVGGVAPGYGWANEWSLPGVPGGAGASPPPGSVLFISTN